MHACQLYEEIPAAVDALRGQVRGEVIVAASSTPGAYLVPELLRQFQELYPEVRPVPRVGDSAQVLEWLMDYRAPLGVIGEMSIADGLHSVEIGADRLQLVAAAGDALCRVRQVKPEHLRGRALLPREQGSGTRAGAETLLGERLHFHAQRPDRLSQFIHINLEGCQCLARFIPTTGNVSHRFFSCLETHNRLNLRLPHSNVLKRAPKHAPLNHQFLSIPTRPRSTVAAAKLRLNLFRSTGPANRSIAAPNSTQCECFRLARPPDHRRPASIPDRPPGKNYKKEPPRHDRVLYKHLVSSNHQ